MTLLILMLTFNSHVGNKLTHVPPTVTPVTASNLPSTMNEM